MKTTASTEQNQKRAFTLVELVVVIAILALLAAMSLPALCKTNIKSRALLCMGNKKVLTTAWLMYSAENNNKLLDSRAWMTVEVSNPASDAFIDLANQLPLQPLGKYLNGNVKEYRCPDDPRKSTRPGYVGTPACRTASMNAYIGEGWTSGYFIYKKLSDLNRPGPMNTFVFADEGLSINDGHFVIDMDTYDPNNLPGKQLTDVPATYHNMGGTFSFADGRSELRKWKDPRTALPTGFGWVSPNNLDIDWLQSKSSAKITNPTR